MFEKNSHCSYCGKAFLDVKFPQECYACANITYINPLPVIVAMIMVNSRERPRIIPNGILIQKRNIEPQKGNWALPGGYIDEGESWQVAAAREVQEEIGLYTTPEQYELMDVKTANNGNLLVFCKWKYLVINLDSIPFIPNKEVTAIDVAYDPIELAFPTHTEMLRVILPSLNDY